MNMGQCMPNGNGFMCKCPPGFTGQKCENRDPCTPNPVFYLLITVMIIIVIFLYYLLL